MNELEVTQLPQNLCAPVLQPVLSGRVRNLCKTFPKEAAAGKSVNCFPWTAGS